MSEGVPQVIGTQQVVGGQVVQGQLVQSHVVHGQMVNSAGQQIVTQLVGGQQVQGSIIHQAAPGATVVATSLPSGLTTHQVVQGQPTQHIQTVNHQVVTQPVSNQATNIKPAAITQAVPPPSPGTQTETLVPVINKPRMTDLVREIDPNEQLDEEVEEMLFSIADDFIESTVNAACRLAKHRNARTLDVRDVQTYLERNWHMWIPGFGTEELRPYKRAPTTEAHKQRLALIRKAIKKY